MVLVVLLFLVINWCACHNCSYIALLCANVRNYFALTSWLLFLEYWLGGMGTIEAFLVFPTLVMHLFDHQSTPLIESLMFLMMLILKLLL